MAYIGLLNICMDLGPLGLKWGFWEAK